MQRDAKRKKVVCFGAGKQLQEFAKAVPYIEVYKVIDNYKYGNDVNIQSRKLSVISFNEFLEIYESVKNDVILVITCLSFVDIIHQIENIRDISRFRVLYLSFVVEYTEETTIPSVLQGKH